MKQIIILLTFLTVFAGYTNAYTVVSGSGHKYAYYKCGFSVINYELKIDVRDDDFYGYASVTAFFSGKSNPKGIELRPGMSIQNLKKSGKISAASGEKIARVKLAASGETRTQVTYVGNGNYSVGVITAWGRATATW